MIPGTFEPTFTGKPDGLGGRVSFLGEDGAWRHLRPFADGPRHSQEHSWGYLGSGCAETAYTIIRTAAGGRKPTPTLYQAFKERYVAVWPQRSEWRISLSEVRDFIARTEIERGDNILWDD